MRSRQIASLAHPYLPLAAVAVLLLPVLASAQASAPTATPQDLARLWDGEHVSAPLPPLLRHADVDSAWPNLRRDGAGPVLARGDRPVGRGAVDQPRVVRPRPASRAPLVADARRRADGDVGALRPLRVRAAAPRRARRRPAARRPDHPRRPDAQPRRRRAVPAAQRAGHRHQPRRAAAAGAGGPRPEGAARPAERRRRLQPPQPELAHVGGQDRRSRRRSRCSRWPSTRRAPRTTGAISPSDSAP